MRGFFLTLEGGEGVGKSTLAKSLAESARKRGIDVVLTREPGGTPIGEELRQIFKYAPPQTLDSYTEALLIFAARRLHIQQVIMPALERGALVICDRYRDSTYVYQCVLGSLAHDTFASLEKEFAYGLLPNLTLMLDASVAELLKRISGRVADRFDDTIAERGEALRHGFLALADAEPQRCVVIPANRPAATILRQAESFLALSYERYTPELA